MRVRIIKQETQEKQELSVPGFMEESPIETIVGMYIENLILYLSDNKYYGTYIVELYTVDDFNREQVLTRSRITSRPKDVDGITVDIPPSAFCPN